MTAKRIRPKVRHLNIVRFIEKLPPGDHIIRVRKPASLLDAEIKHEGSLVLFDADGTGTTRTIIPGRRA